LIHSFNHSIIMAYEVINFKKEKDAPESTRLLSRDQKESSFNKPKKKGLFSKLVGSKKRKEDDDEYQPPTAPSSPEFDVDTPTPLPLNVSVIPKNVGDRATPYRMNKADTAISDITSRDMLLLASSPRRVGFDASTKEQQQQSSLAPSTTLGGSETTTTPGGNNNALSSLATPTPSTSETYSDGGVWNQTLGMLDDICQVPSMGKKNLDYDLAAAASPSLTNTNTRDNNKLRRPLWGSVPSEDDEDTFMEHSMESTYYGNSTFSPDRTTSTGFQTATSRGDTTTRLSTLTEVQKRKTTTPEEQHAAVALPTHENFEVVLDSALLTGSSIPKRSGSRGWFGKKDDEEEEEEKKSDKAAEAAAAAAADSKEQHVSSHATKTNVAAAALKGGGAEPEDTADNSSSPKKPSLIKRFSMVKLGKPKESQDDKLEEEGWNKSTKSLVGTKFVDQPTTRTSKSWNSVKKQLQSAKENIKAKKEKSSEEKKERSSEKKKEKRPRRSQSLGPFIAKLKIPVAILRKKAKDDSELESSPKSPEKSAPQKRSKPAWKAVEDPGSGKTYFYHRKTRETTWKKPKELEDYENALKASTTVDEKEKEVTLQESENQGMAPETPSPTQAPNASSSGVAVAYVTPSQTADVAVAPASPATHPAVISAAYSAESQDQDGDEPHDVGLNKSRTFDDAWERKREINRLLTGLPPSDKASVNKIMVDSAGNEDELLRQLRDLVESQPFDEPFLDEPDANDPDEPPSPTRSSYAMNGRVRTYASRASAATKSSAKTEQTEKIKNTSAGRLNTIAPISESKSTATSISSNHNDDNMYPGLPPPGSHLNKPNENARIPSKVPAIPRKRELRIEEFSGSKAEIFDVTGRVVRGGTTDNNNTEDSYCADNEVDTYGTDSVSALSENDTDFLSRKDNFDQARRRALDDAIVREDWELAAVLTEGLRQSGGCTGRDIANAHNTWNQSELDKFIYNNDWSAVSGYIAQMLDSKNKEPPIPNRDELVIPKPSVPPAAAMSIVRVPPAADSEDPSLKKKIGSTSQLQHRELLSESSWTSDSSYDSYDSDYS
jgi:hypothetical protein